MKKKWEKGRKIVMGITGWVIVLIILVIAGIFAIVSFIAWPIIILLFLIAVVIFAGKIVVVKRKS